MIESKNIEGLVFRGGWKNVERPGYFGRRRDQKISELNDRLGNGNWRLAWCVPIPNPSTSSQLELVPEEAGDLAELLVEIAEDSNGPDANFQAMTVATLPFVEACGLYEESYVRWLRAHPAELEFACSYGECIDNAPTNVLSGRDYNIQESYSTHIQDISMRNALHRLGRKFEGPSDKILVIRSKDSDGYRFGPGNIPFAFPESITQPSKCPTWAKTGSVEDFWQSNKWLQVRV